MPVDLGQFQAAHEAFRRRSQEVSRIGVGGGAGGMVGGMTRSTGVSQPITPSAPSGPTSPGGPGGPGISMSQGGMQQLKQSMPDEAMVIVKALIQRLRNLGGGGRIGQLAGGAMQGAAQ